MTPEFVIGFFMDAMRTGLMLAGPMLAVGLLVGITVSIFQAATQINEMTLVFVPKIVGVGLALLISLPWMIRVITDFTTQLFIHLPEYIR